MSALMKRLSRGVVGRIILLLFLLVLALGVFFGSRKSDAHVEIVFFLGGAPDSPFSQIIHEGARAAQRDLGAKVTYVWSNWDREVMVQQFITAMAQKPDAIVMTGYPGEEILTPYINEAFRRGILVTGVNVDLTNLREEYSLKGFGYVGSVLYSAGAALGSMAVRHFQLQSGDQALVFGIANYPERGLRTKGALASLREAGLRVDYVEVSMEMRNSPQQHVLPVLQRYFSHTPSPDLILVDDALIYTMPEILAQAGKLPGEVKVAGADLSPQTIEAVKSGYVGLLLDQQPYLQGYLPVLQSVLSVKYGFSGLFIDTGSAFITADNVEFVERLVEKRIR